MIEFESEEIEDAAMNGDIPIAAAFEVHLEAGKAPEILTYRCTEDIAREFEKRFSDDPLGNAASNFITARFMDFYKKSGMMFDRKSSRVICEYFICDAERIPEYDRTAAKSVKAALNIPRRDDLSDSSTDGGLCCAVVKDGKTVAIAGVNDFRMILRQKCMSNARRLTEDGGMPAARFPLSVNYLFPKENRCHIRHAPKTFRHAVLRKMRGFPRSGEG